MGKDDRQRPGQRRYIVRCASEYECGQTTENIYYNCLLSERYGGFGRLLFKKRCYQNEKNERTYSRLSLEKG